MASRTSARCVVCKEPIPLGYVRVEGQESRLGTQLMAVAVDGKGGRRYLDPSLATEPPAVRRPADAPELELLGKATINVGGYGIATQADLYTNRQLVMLGAFADAVRQVPAWVADNGGDEIQARTVASVVGLCVSKLAMSHSTQARMEPQSGTSNGGSRFSRVIEPSGRSMNVSAALTLISRVTGEVLDEFVGDLDGETRWAMGWFKDRGFEAGAYDDAAKLFTATNTSLEGVERAGVATGAKGKVRLVRRDELPGEWDPATDGRLQCGRSRNT